jgi:protein-disulfide isomerase
MTAHTPLRVALKRIEATLAACVIAFAACMFPSGATGQSVADIQKMQSEIDGLLAAQQALREELKALKALMLKASPPATAESAPAATELSLRGAQIKGAQTAQVVLVEFSDFQCPFCARHASLTYPQIIREYVDTGRLRYAFMNLPIESLHPLAFKQHLAAACAADQGHFWEMHDLLFSNPGAADLGALVAHAKALGLDISTFRACVEGELHAGEIRQAAAVGNAAGVNGTPTFLIGVLDTDNKFKAVRVIAGARPYPAFKEAIDGVLSANAASPGAAPARLAGLPRLGNTDADP